MKKGSEYEFNIVDMDFPGTGIAESDGRKVYIKNTVPGEVVKARITKKKKEYAEAKLIEVIKNVDFSCEPNCPHFNLCGGCSFQFVPYEKQLELKKNQVLKLFENAGIQGYEFLGIEGSPEEFQYRNKMEFSFGDMEKGGELSLGMHVPNKNFSIVTVESCKIVDKDFRIILNTVLSYLKKADLPYYKVMRQKGYLRNLVVRKGKNTKEILINIVTTSQQDFDYNELTEILKNIKYDGELKGILHTINDSIADVVKVDKIDVLYGRDYIYEELLGLKFKISPGSFFQTNTRGAEKLYGIVKDFLGNCSSKTVLDLYCGTGTIGQIAASSAKEVIGIELIEEAAKAANENARLNGLENCSFIAGDVAEVIKDIHTAPDAIILDPPRPGVHPKALEYVVKFNSPVIVYVSCNPKTLVNDLKYLLANGYKIDKLKIMDLFPHTPHVECVVLMSRVKE